MVNLAAVICKVAGVVVALAVLLDGCRLTAQQPVVTKAFAPTRFTVVDAGTAGKPDVILIPGLASSRAVWDAEAAKLAPNFRLHLVQVDGFAGQPAGANAGSTDVLPGIVEELHGYIAAKGMHPDVVGHSMGGLLTLMWAERYPGDVRRIVVVDSLPFYALLFNPAATPAAVKPIADGLKAQLMGATPEQFAAGSQQSAAQMVKDPTALKLIVASSTASDRGVFVEAMTEDMMTDVRADLPAVKAPTLVLYEHDPTLQMPNADSYEQIVVSSYKPLTTAKLVRVDDSRHFIMYDQPAKFDAAVEEFLR